MITLRQPTIDAKVGLPVSRWYAAGSDGEPWDGVMQAREKKLVHVIGYASEPVQPGTDVDATIHVASLTVRAKARARKRWNQPE